MSKYASKIQAQLLKNCEERAKAFEATKDERRQLFDEFLTPRKSVLDPYDRTLANRNTLSEIKK